MAIKVGGTTVIDDSRNLSNIAGGLKTINNNSLLGSGDVTISSTDQATHAYAWSSGRTAGITHYPGFTNGKYIRGVAGQSDTTGGSFSNGSFAGGGNYGSYQVFFAFAVRTS